MKKNLEGWLGGHYDELSLHKTKKDAERGMMALNTLDDDLLEFQGKEVRITIEVIEDKDEFENKIKKFVNSIETIYDTNDTADFIIDHRKELLELLK